MNMQVNWAEHYKAVGKRLGKLQVVPPVVMRPSAPEPVPAPVADDASPSRDILRVASETPRRAKIKEIIREVCAEYGVNEMDVLSHRRGQRFTRPRQKICYRLRLETTLSMPSIGRFMNRDHTSVLHSIRKAEALIAAGEMTAPAPAACVEG
jgi:hypothetical protein